MLRLGVLASGSGSNLQAILEACAARKIDAEVAVVLCNVKGAGAIARAEKAGVAVSVIEHKGFPTREAFDEAMAKVLQGHGVQLICLAGFMRLLSPVLLRAFPGAILNIHPSLLPAFPGTHVHRQALDAGVRISGCTVHFVDEGCDTGPILLQAAVPVLPGDDKATLAARILEQEHAAYPRAIELVARGQAKLVGKRVQLDGGVGAAASLLASS